MATGSNGDKSNNTKIKTKPKALIHLTDLNTVFVSLFSHSFETGITKKTNDSEVNYR
ncbi:hypothetical protein R50073_30150 [Maricurvus nonylphenolicus]